MMTKLELICGTGAGRALPGRCFASFPFEITTAILVRVFGAAVLLAIGLAGADARAAVPGEINYQGLLLDDTGAPVNASISMSFGLFNVETGGTALWSEAHPSVGVVEGVYEVALGSKTAIDPAVMAGGSLYLEVVVGGETLTPRQRLLAVPYALRAGIAEDAEGLGGVPSVFLTELYKNFDFDGGAPPNDHPDEGFDDADGDGLLNFVDPDNDNDGISDAAEFGLSDINVVTPAITSISPSFAASGATTTVNIGGMNFDVTSSVTFGSKSPAVTLIGSTLIQVQVGPQTPGFPTIAMSLGNGESADATGLFEFRGPIITSLTPDGALETVVTEVTIRGEYFAPGAQVQFGSQNPTVIFDDSTQLRVTVGPQALGPASVTVTLATGEVAVSPVDFLFFLGRSPAVFVTSETYTGDLGGMSGADGKCNALAQAAELSGTYMAWIGDGSQAPSSRFNRSVPGWTRMDGVTVADDWIDLTDGQLLDTISQDETGAYTPTNSWVWTSVDPSGSSQPLLHCNGWTSAGGTSGGFGVTSRVDAKWTEYGFASCASQARLYCFPQQP